MNHVFVADIHIKLGQKNVPREWQYNRLMMLADELNNYNEMVLVIGGDLLDVANPSMEEVCAMFDFIRRLQHKEILLIPGNHEMKTKKKDCFVVADKILRSLNVKVVREFETIYNVDYIPYNILKETWPAARSKYAITHVRGEIPPHVQPEIPLEKLSKYEKVLAGDLHSNKNSQGNILYPGSPYTTSFHRSVPSNSNGIFIFNSDTGSCDFVELRLPQLIRSTIKTAEEAVATDYHHTIYEIEGNLSDLAKVKNTELLSKKIAKDIVTPPTLQLEGTIEEELTTYFKTIHKMPESGIAEVLSLYKESVDDSN
jgi:DNA repair exonuclease SbcCD nuclease subunit